jgi:hypothetical protein
VRPAPPKKRKKNLKRRKRGRKKRKKEGMEGEREGRRKKGRKEKRKKEKNHTMTNVAHGAGWNMTLRMTRHMTSVRKQNVTTKFKKTLALLESLLPEYQVSLTKLSENSRILGWINGSTYQQEWLQRDRSGIVLSSHFCGCSSSEALETIRQTVLLPLIWGELPGQNSSQFSDSSLERMPSSWLVSALAL